MEGRIICSTDSLTIYINEVPHEGAAVPLHLNHINSAFSASATCQHCMSYGADLHPGFISFFLVVFLLPYGVLETCSRAYAHTWRIFGRK